MSGLVALCHFCEIHGPSVIMVTQTVRDCQMPSSDQQCIEGKTEDPRVPHHHEMYGCQKLFSDEQTKRDKGGCDGCWSLGGQDNFIVSNDHGGKQTFVSSETVINTDLMKMIRHAVIRSISCESSANKEGPIIFSDPTVSSVLAKNFFLKDSRARGFQRYYSIIIVTRESGHLISNWKNIEKAMSEVIEPLKSKATDRYILETKTVMNLKEKREIMQAKTFNHRRGSAKSARNLKELTTDPNIYEMIHGKFVTILSSSEKSLKKKY